MKRVDKVFESKERGSGLDEKIIIGNIVFIEFENKTRYFEIISITGFHKDIDPILNVRAKNYGYYDLIKNVDIRDIMYKPIEFVTDIDVNTKLRKESCYC